MKWDFLNIKTKQVKYGGYSIAITAILVAILIILNLFVGKIDFQYDLTKSNFYSLSDKTKDMLSELNKDINIYVLEETGKENDMFKDIIEQYDNAKHVKVTYKDPILYPLFAENYKEKDETIKTGSIIVESGNKFEVIDVMELYNVKYDQNYQPVVESFAIEEKVTNAIVYVASDVDPEVCVITGHDELEIPPVLSQLLLDENYSIKNVKLKEEELDPTNNILLFMSPQLDLLDEEVDLLTDFFGKGGKAVFMLYYSMPKLPNLEKVMARYGIEVQRGVVVEGNSKYSFPGDPTSLFPSTFVKHAITESLGENEIYPVFPLTLGLKPTELLSKDVKITPLYSTSENSYIKTNLMSSTIEQEVTDIPGPTHLAISSSETYYEGATTIETKILVLGTPFILDQNKIPLNSVGNIDFVMNSFKWMSGTTDLTYIRPKTVDTYQIKVTGQQTILYGLLFALIIPLLIIGIGVTVWLRRRHL